MDILVRLRYIGIMSSGRVLPSSAARFFASWEVSYIECSRNRFTLNIVMRDVGEDEMTIMGPWLPVALLAYEHRTHQ